MIPNELDELIKENRILRELLWLNHGHSVAQLYGDDDEMQCQQCFLEFGFVDWKRTPAKEIRKQIMDAKLAEMLNKVGG